MCVTLAQEHLPSSAETRPALLLQHIMMVLCRATVTHLALQEASVMQLEDSVPAGCMWLGGSAQSVPLDTSDFPTADVSQHLPLICSSFLFKSSFTPCYLLSKYNLHLILSSLRSSLRSMWLWPPTMWRSDRTLHLPSSDSQTGLRCVSESDFQLPPFAGLWELWMLPKRHRCKCRGSVWPQYWSVQVSWNLHEEQTVQVTIFAFTL